MHFIYFWYLADFKSGHKTFSASFKSFPVLDAFTYKSSYTPWLGYFLIMCSKSRETELLKMTMIHCLRLHKYSMSEFPGHIWVSGKSEPALWNHSQFLELIPFQGTPGTESLIQSTSNRAKTFSENYQFTIAQEICSNLGLTGYWNNHFSDGSRFSIPPDSYG